MQLSYAAVATENPAKSRTYLLASCLLTAGFLVRAIWAASVFLNADEAMHYVLSNQPSFALTYQATLSTAHPPLFIIMLLTGAAWAPQSLFYVCLRYLP